MKRLSLLLVALGMTIGFTLAPVGVFAATPEDPIGTACTAVKKGNSDICKTPIANGDDPLTGPEGIIVKASQIIAILTGVACVIVIIIAGIRYATSAGDSNSVEGAKNAILYALIGAAVASVSPFIIGFVVSKFSG